uniref:Protein NO VEIN C-terminal domain-containing protein n=2 Tax=Eptatretus burgeri TaxID=7764 RepID=A0A8C4R3G4_EPTBU
MHWVPAKTPDMDRPGYLTKGFCAAQDLYMDLQELSELLDCHVPYVAIALPASDLHHALGIRTTISLDEVLKLFQSWCLGKGEEGGKVAGQKGAAFKTKYGHIHKVYDYLCKNCSQQQLKDLFNYNPAIFLPDSSIRKYDRDEHELLSGHFYNLKDVCWSDPTNMFHHYNMLIVEGSSLQKLNTISSFYSVWPEISFSLKQILDVPAMPSMKNYVDLLCLITENSKLPNMDVLDDVFHIYAILAYKCKHERRTDGCLDESYCTFLKGMLADTDAHVFPSKCHRWSSLKSQLLIPDDKILEKLFCKQEGVTFLHVHSDNSKITDNSQSWYKNKRTFWELRDEFLKICELHKLSDVVSTELQTEGYAPCPTLQNYVSILMPYIQAFLHSRKQFQDVYASLLNSGIAEKLKKMQFAQVDQLYILHRLTLSSSIALVRVETVCGIDKRCDFFIQKHNVIETDLKALVEVCVELSKFFSQNNKECQKDLDYFLHLLTSMLRDKDKERLRLFLQTNEVVDLPQEEPQWEVPKPIIMSAVQGKYQTPKEVSQHQVATPAENGEENEPPTTLQSWPPRSGFGKSNPSNLSLPEAVENVIRMWPPPAPSSDMTLSGTERSSDIHSRTDQIGAFIKSDGERQLHHDQLHSVSKNTYETHRPNSAMGVPNEETCSRKPGSSASSISSSAEPNGDTVHTDAKVSEMRTLVEGADSLHKGITSSSTGADVNGTRNDGSGKPRSTASIDTAPRVLTDPIWNVPNLENKVFEQLPFERNQEMKDVLNNALVSSNHEFENVGLWGECFVQAYLLQWKKDGPDPRPTKVEWANEKGESGWPFDFAITFQADESLSNKSVLYIEVKSTVHCDKTYFEISPQELELANDKGESYQLYRVYSACNIEKACIHRIRNLAGQLRTKDLQLFVFV